MPDLFERVNEQRIALARSQYAAAYKASLHPPHGEVGRRRKSLQRAMSAKLAAEMGKPAPLPAD